MEYLWGIDLGGSKLEGIVLEKENLSTPLARKRIKSEAAQGYDHILSRIKLLLQEMAAEIGTRPKRIGIGHPGVLDPQSRTLKNSNTTSMNGRAFQRDLEDLLKIPLTLANDANCFALAESNLGAAMTANSVFGVIMGTGVGGGIVIDGKVLSGIQGIAGEWGHNILQHDGPECYCGRRGCVETIISGPALEAYYQSLSGNALKLEDISKAENFDPHAKETLSFLTTNFGRAIASVINILDPECIVLGGGVSNIELLYTTGIEETKKHVFNNRFETRIVQNQLGDSAGVFGAALLVR